MARVSEAIILYSLQFDATGKSQFKIKNKVIHYIICCILCLISFLRKIRFSLSLSLSVTVNGLWPLTVIGKPER